MAGGPGGDGFDLGRLSFHRSALAQFVMAGLGLALFGDRHWNAMSNGGYEEGPGLLLYWLGVSRNGFYRGLGARILMLISKLLLTAGIAAAVICYLVLILGLTASQAELRATDVLVARISGVIAFGCLAMSFLIGALFRRLLPPPRLRESNTIADNPIFLRSFRDDSVRLRNAHWLAPLPLPSDLPRTLDEIILARLPDTTAIGRPDDPRLPFGVSRLYLEDRPWQAVVSQLLDRSRTVLLCIDQTQGLEWEINETLVRGHARKAKFIQYAAPSMRAGGPRSNLARLAPKCSNPKHPRPLPARIPG